MDTKRRKPEEVVAKLRHRSPMRSARSCRQSPNRPVAGAQSVSQRLVPSLAVARELASVVRADYVAPLPGAVRFNPRLALGRLSSHAPFEADRDELLRFDSEFHRQMLQHVPNKAVDDERRRFLCRQAALQAVKTSAHPKLWTWSPRVRSQRRRSWPRYTVPCGRRIRG